MECLGVVLSIWFALVSIFVCPHAVAEMTSDSTVSIKPVCVIIRSVAVNVS